MAKGRAATAPRSVIPKQFSSLREIDQAVAKLQRRIKEVQDLKDTGVRYDDQKIQTIEMNIVETIREVYGQDSPEFHTHEHIEIHDGVHFISLYQDRDSSPERQAHFLAGIPKSIEKLKGLITRLEEKKSDFEASPEEMANVAFQGLSLHPRVASVCTSQFRDGHYPEAVFNAAKCLEGLVKEKSGRFDLEGVNLMRTVFTPRDPVLSFNSLSNQTDQDEQDGMMNFFAGVSLGIRNPHAHAFPTLSLQIEHWNILGL